MTEQVARNLDGIVITDELAERPRRPPEHEGENIALTDLAETLAAAPESVLQRLVEVAMTLTRSQSAGISLLEPGGEEGSFRWVATAGAWAPYRDGTMPRGESPCGEVMTREAVLLLKEPERVFPALLQAEPGIGEGLVAPFDIDGVPGGTVWVIKHGPDGRFDGEDARLLQSLARFASAGRQMLQALEAAKLSQRGTEQHLQLALDAAALGTFTWYPEEDRSEPDKRILELFGLEPGATLNLENALATMIHPDDRQRYADGVARAIDPGGDGRLSEDIRIHLPDKSIRWIAMNGQTYFEGTPPRAARMAGTAADVTEAKQAEERRARAEAAYRDSEARYGALFAASPVPFMVLAPNAPDFTITAANDAYFAATLTTRESLVGRRLFDVFTDDPSRPGQLGSEALAISLDHVLTTRTTDAMERVRYDLVVPGGFEPHWWEAINAPMLDGSGEVSAIIHQVTRVTELHYAEESELEEQEHQAFLLKLSDALRAEPSAEAVADRALQMLFEQMELDRCYIVIYRPEEDQAVFPHQLHDDSLSPLPAYVPLSDFPKGFELVSERTLVIDNIAEKEGLSDADRANIEALGVRALLNATLRKGGNNPLWAIAAGSKHPRVWTQSEISLVEEVAERTWAAVERARAEAATREAEGRYLALFNAIDQGACTIEIKFDDQQRAIDYRFLEISPHFERQAGFAAAPGSWMRDIAPDHDEHWFEIYGRVALTGKPARFENFSTPLDHWWSVYAFKVEGPNTIAVLFHDITDRKRAEQELASREQQFETLLDRAPLGVYLVDSDFVIRQVNPVAMPVFGDIPGGPVGRDFEEVIHILWEQDYADEVVGIFRHTLDTGEPYVTPERAEQRSDRNVTEYYEWRLDRIILPDGRYGIVCYFRDISAQVQARKEIEEGRELARESEARFRQFGEFSSDVIWIRDAETMQFEYVSPAIEAIYGVAPKDFAARHDDLKAWAEILHPDDRAHALDSFRRVRAGERMTHEFRIQRPDGAERWIRNTDFPLLDAAGRVQRIAGIGKDVTEQKGAEEALREREERLGIIVENARDYAIFTIDTDGIVTDWREGAEAVFGWSPGEAVGMDSRLLYTPEDREQRETENEMRIASEEGRAPDIRWHVRKDGSRVFLDGVMTRLGNGATAGFLKIAQDVTNRHAADELQRLLLAELQHRVRNILALIRSVTRRTAETSETVQEYAQHLEGRINAMARTQAILTRTPGDPVDLEDIVRAELLSAVAPEEKVWCEGPEVRLEAKAAEVLTLAVHELATNAVKYGAFSQPEGQLEIAWAVERRGAERWLVFTWEEARVEGVQPNGRQGFGTELITRRVPYELGGSGTYDLRRGGIKSVIEFPLRAGGSVLESGMAGIGGTG